MLTDSRKKEITSFAEKQVAGNDSLHGLAHLQQTAKLARWLAKAENGDPEVCWAAAMLHDICKNYSGDHAAKGAELALEFLLSMGLPKEFADKVADAIRFHNKEFSEGAIERKILWDADKLPIMAPEGFETRMLPYWKMRKGEVAGTKKAIEEYAFYKPRFHTETARREVEKYSGEMDRRLKEFFL